MNRLRMILDRKAGAGGINCPCCGGHMSRKGRIRVSRAAKHAEKRTWQSEAFEELLDWKNDRRDEFWKSEFWTRIDPGTALIVDLASEQCVCAVWPMSGRLCYPCRARAVLREAE